ncbi:uncharacterized protein LOC131650897 [Vicia villosa]|uniref:uncharacterized protein LOC131650897 n=1 Tax=Vicia villosa TaxID=3911 RepID=UPI00273B4E9C|nr:uncharacterized protein LOC131650897 [Vicia villosa]
MVHPDIFLKDVSAKVNDDAKPNEVNDDSKIIVVEIDMEQQFSNDQVFNARQHMLDWVRMEASKLGFVIGRSDNDTSRRQEFVTMICERGEKYVSKVWKLKHDDTGSRKCERQYKLRRSCKVDDMWRFSVICGKHNHVLDTKLHI